MHYIYLEQSQQLPAQTLESILNEFASEIVPTITTKFGPVPDFDGNGKIILLLYDIPDPSNDGTVISGYFSPNDLLRNSSSNYGEILYMDTDPGLNSLEDFYLTLTHELQHMANFWSNNRGSSTTVRISETWIDEGLSLAAEELYSGRRSSSLFSYYFGPASEQIVAGNNFFHWDNLSRSDYSSAYLFFHWLRLQTNSTDTYLSASSESVYSVIFRSPYGNYRAITNLANVYNGLSSLRRSSPAETWEQILAHWFAATVIQAPQGLLGFENYGNSFSSPPCGDGTVSVYYYRREGIVNIVNTVDNERHSLSPGDRIIVAQEDFTSPVEMSASASGNLVLYGIDIKADGTRRSPRNSNTIACLVLENTGLTRRSTADILIAFNSQVSPMGTEARTGAFTSLRSSAQNSAPSLSHVPSQRSAAHDDFLLLDEELNGPIPMGLRVPIENE